MSQLEDEIDTNHAVFFRNWTAQSTANWKVLEKVGAYRTSYRRICALQALKTHIVVPFYSSASAGFFFEAHNDALVSHVSASVGAWRSALQALRSCIENVLCAIYYNDHSIELELWRLGKFYIGFSDLIRYLERHPRLSELDAHHIGIPTLRAEYALLSKAVHASAVDFRMTDPVSNVLLWDVDPVKASKWSAQEKKVIEGVSLLMVALHRVRLQGAQLTPLRNVLRFSISSANRKRLRQHVHVNIPDK